MMPCPRGNFWNGGGESESLWFGCNHYDTEQSEAQLYKNL